jgi:3-oxoadipate enol-lactonase
VTDESVARLNYLLPDARLGVIEGAAHLANVEQPEAVTREILDHLAVREGR